MSEEDKEFIENAFAHAMSQIADPNKIFQEATEKMQSPDATEEEVATCLELCDQSCDDADVARNAEKLGGIQALLDAAERRPSIGVKTRALEILALLLSNNPEIQQAAAKRNAMAVLQGMVTAAPHGDVVRSKAFRTLVALVRGVEGLEVAFLAEGGLAVTLDCLDANEDPKLRERALSFLRSLLVEGRLPEANAAEASPALARLLSGAGAESSLQYRETLASSCLALAQRAPSAAAMLAPIAQTRLAQLGSADETEAEMLRDVVSVLGA